MSIEIEIKCSECGKDLESRIVRQASWSNPAFIEVDPCPACLEAARATTE
jgi:hypothetical protein